LEKQTAQRLDRAEQQNAQRFDRVEKQLDNTKKQLQNQGQQCAAMEATLQQSLTAQNAQILQIQSDYQMSHCDTSQQVQQVRAEAKTQKTRMTTITMETQFRNETEKLRG
jgi:hypothetical protein